jgi:hypothetical protein
VAKIKRNKDLNSVIKKFFTGAVEKYNGKAFAILLLSLSQPQNESGTLIFYFNISTGKCTGR